MDLSSILDFILQQGIWCALFVWLLLDSQKKAQAREDKLTGIIEKQGINIEEIADSLKTMNKRIEKVEHKLDIENDE